jgi:hypothetical protein
MGYAFKYKLKKIIIRSLVNRLSEIRWDNPPNAPPT